MLKARIVLDDCRYARQMLDSVLDEPRFRVYWAASLTLLRAVGHVLRKVDAEWSEEVSKAVQSAWARWNADKETNAIFWEFIERERNLMLKEYELRVGFDGVDVVDGGPDGVEVAEHLTSEYYMPITEGRFASEDARELVRDAIQWWEQELATIEGQLIGGGADGRGE